MKILAIRGSNLASLYGDFEVDLAAEPLASAGLFAITGATGSGKSTLLDALCLALFNKTPRLAKTGGALVGHADQEDALRLAAQDVRGLLSRGQGSGFAEVDFANRDGQRWRARWEVHRARERADGRLQQQTLLLENLESGDRVGGTKTEVLDAIRQQVGLSFDQFRRSVLLAQGDFAAFLHADSKERAELLEKVTGTDIYAHLSVAAFERAKAERALLDDLARQRDQLGILSTEQRQLAEQEQATAAATLRAAQQALKGTEATTRWYAKLAELRSLESSGQADHAEAAKRWEGARERRQTLDLVKAAQPLRPLLSAQETATQRRHETRQQVGQESDGVENARQVMNEAAARLTAARQAQEKAKQEQHAKAPELEQATLLDDRLAAAAHEAGKAREAATTAAEQARQTHEKSVAALAAVSAEKTRREAAASWLESHPEAQVLNSHWNHVEAALREHGQASEAAAQAEEQLPALQEEATQAAAAAGLAISQAQETSQRLEERQQAVEQAEAAIPEGGLERLGAQRKALESRRQAVRGAEEALAEAHRARDEQQRAESAAQEAGEKEQAARDAIDRHRLGLREHAIRVEEAERAWRATQAIRDLEDRRADLVDGQPCPLCGSTSHPFHHGGAPSDALEEHSARLRELKTKGEQLNTALGKAEEQAQASRADVENQRRNISQAVARLADPQRAWAQALDTLRQLGLQQPNLQQPNLQHPNLPEDLLSEEAAGRVATVVAGIEQASADLDQEEQGLKRLERTARESRNARDLARQERDQREAARVQASELERRASAAFEAGQRCQEEERKRVAATLKSLATSLGDGPGWRQELAADGEAFSAECRRQVLAFKQHTTVHQEAVTALAALELSEAKANAEEEAARTAATATEEKFHHSQAAVTALQEAREKVLDGQAVAEVKQALTQATTEAEHHLEVALQGERDARATLMAAEAKLEGAQEQLRKETSALEKAQNALEKALHQAELDLETLRQRLQHDMAWCDTETRALEEIQQAVQSAASVLTERRKRRQEHEGKDRPEVSVEEAAGQQERAAEEHRRAESVAQDQLLVLRRDDEARARGAALSAEIAQQESQAARWATLNEVIGSSKGDKFRKFAQGLTLDALLGYANAHLQKLAPRYRLDRIPQEDLELQVVDLDMGDEVRSINSLSGGETFLASLALALGLSSLSASDTPVESLFIDEGFGTLDLETLETALSALDSLQASGRQVGMISHVQDLGQRVGVQVQVVKLGAGRSRVEVIGGT